MRWRLVAAVSVVVVAVIGVWIGVSRSGGGDDALDRNASSAHAACAEFTRERLKEPAAVAFPGYQDGGVSVTHSGTTWTVSSFVDGTDGSGVNLRLHFRCILTDNGDSWHLDDWTETAS